MTLKLRTFLVYTIAIVTSLTVNAGMQPPPGGPDNGPGNMMLPPTAGPQSSLTGEQQLMPNQGTPWEQPGPPPVNQPSMGPGWMSPNTVMQSAFPNQNNEQSGTVNVMACGYDAQGIWRVMPLRVTYQWNGAQYQVTVLNAWNPWSDTWNMGVDLPAYNTNYILRGTTFDFYTVLSTGTFYFNL